MMTTPNERFAYSAMPSRPALRLPGRARLAVVTVVNVEAWDITRPMPRTVLSAPAGASVTPDVPNWAWHEYGMRVGFWRLKAMLDRLGIKATTAINGAVFEQYPVIAAAMRDAGWEFMAHGYGQVATHQEQDERAMVRRAVDAIRAFTGKPPRGWLAPGLTETWQSPEVLVENGIEYVCDWVADEQPFDMRTAAGPLVSVPYSVELNDIPMMLIQHHAAREFLSRVRDQFDRLYAEAARSARVMTVAVHPYVSGVPHRIRYVEQAYDYMAAKPSVLFWTAEQVLDWWRLAREKPTVRRARRAQRPA